MKKAEKLKRRAAARMIHAGCRAIEIGTHEFFQLIRANNAKGSAAEQELRACFTDKEYRVLESRRKKINELVEDLRKLARHIEKTARNG